MISTRGRYALRVMLELCDKPSGTLTPMKDIANKQDISLKYLEQILPVLVKSGMLEGVHGKNGGYRLTKKPEDYKVGDILKLTEGDLAPVACLAPNAKPCNRKSYCKTLSLWQGYYKATLDYFNGFTLYDLIK